MKNHRPGKKSGPTPARQTAGMLTEEEAAWGIHPVSALLQLRPEQVLELFIAAGRQDRRVEEIRALATQQGLKINAVATLPLVEPDLIQHQGVVARIKPSKPWSLPELLPRLSAGAQPPLVLALDSIQDPRNLGAIIRSAAAFGVNALIIPKDRSAPLSGTVMKAAAGTLPLLDVCQVTNLTDSLAKLQQHGFWIYGAGGEAPSNLYATRLNGPICLVLGNEQKGLRPLVRRQCDLLIAIPLAAGVESLNVAVAAGIILAEIRRQQ